MFRTRKVPTNGGIANIVLIIIGLILSAVLIGLFTYSYRNRSNNPVATPKAETSVPTCGISITTPATDQKVYSGFTITGSENGCGWSAFEGYAGSVIAFKADGTSISEPVPLMVVGDWMQKEVNFKATLTLSQTPSSGEAGFLLFRNDDPSGGNPKVFKVLIKY
jgi:hypothetical protein